MNKRVSLLLDTCFVSPIFLNYFQIKMPKRKCTFNDELQKKYPMFKKGKNDWDVECLICSSNISIANKGISDITDHLNTQKHKSNSKNQASTSSITTFFGKTKPSPDENLIRAAEGATAYHTVNHHIAD